MQKISPFLWFDHEAEEAATFYTKVFKNSKVLSTMPGPDGDVMGVVFELDGVQFMGLNAGPQFKFNEAVSFYVNCKDQEEVDYFWEKLTADGGEENPCGWLKDKFGLSWQIIPEDLQKYIGGPDSEKAGRALQAMLQMHKIDIQKLADAYEGK